MRLELPPLLRPRLLVWLLLAHSDRPLPLAIAAFVVRRLLGAADAAVCFALAAAAELSA